MQERDRFSRFNQGVYLVIGVMMVVAAVHSTLESAQLGEYVFIFGKKSAGGYVAAALISFCFVGGSALAWTSLRNLIKA